MSKAFTKESDGDDRDLVDSPAIPDGFTNYITPAGHKRLNDELGRLLDESGSERTVSIVGVDELDPSRGRVSWVSPIATALLKASIGDVVTMRTPRGPEELEIIAVRYGELP